MTSPETIALLVLIVLMVGYAAPILTVAWLPFRWISWRKQRQARLHARCVEIHGCGVVEIAAGNEVAAHEHLAALQCLERKWRAREGLGGRLRESIGVFIAALAVKGFFTGGSVALAMYLKMGDFRMIDATLEVAAALGALYGAFAVVILNVVWLSNAVAPSLAESLDRMIRAGRSITLSRMRAGSQQTEWARSMLGLGATFTASELDQAYRRLVSRYHPDRHFTKPEPVKRRAQETMKMLNDARDQLRAFAK